MTGQWTDNCNNNNVFKWSHWRSRYSFSPKWPKSHSDLDVGQTFRGWAHSESQPQSLFQSRANLKEGARHAGGWTSLTNTAVQMRWRQTLQADNKRAVDLTLKSQQVSFGTVFAFSTFQTHIKVLQLCFRLRDRFYTHHWFCHFFKNLFTVQNVCLYVCTEQKLLFYSSSLLDVWISLYI